MDNLTRDLLCSWGLAEYIDGFNKGKIDAGLLRLLGTDEINQLIPIPGDRAHFKANLDNWKTELKALEADSEYTGFHNRTPSVQRVHL